MHCVPGHSGCMHRKLWPQAFGHCWHPACGRTPWRHWCCWLRAGLKPPCSSHRAAPGWCTPAPSIVTVTPAVCAQLYLWIHVWIHRWYCIAHPSTGRKFDYSTLASNVITLNRRGTFSLLNFLLCSASLSRGKQAYKSAASLFQLLHVHPPHFHTLARGVSRSLATWAVMDWPNFLQSAAKAVDINFKGKQLPFIITHGFSSASFK